MWSAPSKLARDLRASDWNLVFADAEHIGWQVTGRYPNRRSGLGLLPSPGWDERYAWDGYAIPCCTPMTRIRPRAGWAPPTSAWYRVATACSCPATGRARAPGAPGATGGRSARLDGRDAMALQQDQTTTLAAKLKTQLDSPGFAAPLRQAIAALSAGQRPQAEEALRRLQGFDGRLAAGSGDAALYEAFLQA